MNEVERQIKARDVETAAVVDALQKQIGRWSEQIYDYVNENSVSPREVLTGHHLRYSSVPKLEIQSLRDKLMIPVQQAASNIESPYYGSLKADAAEHSAWKEQKERAISVVDCHLSNALSTTTMDISLKNLGCLREVNAQTLRQMELALKNKDTRQELRLRIQNTLTVFAAAEFAIDCTKRLKINSAAVQQVYEAVKNNADIELQELDKLQGRLKEDPELLNDTEERIQSYIQRKGAIAENLSQIESMLDSIGSQHKSVERHRERVLAKLNHIKDDALNLLGTIGTIIPFYEIKRCFEGLDKLVASVESFPMAPLLLEDVRRFYAADEE